MYGVPHDRNPGQMKYRPKPDEHESVNDNSSSRECNSLMTTR